MTCDLLPIVGNTAGDWLCARIDQHNVASQVVQWYHGGGDWIPWGDDLAQAIIFDSMMDRLSGPTRRHAIPAEDPRGGGRRHDQDDDPILRWALESVPPPVAQLFDAAPANQDAAEVMLHAHVAEVAVRCERILSKLTQATREVLERLFSNDPDLARDQLAEWSFDVDRIPHAKRTELERRSGVSLADLQDWDAAFGDALAVTSLAPELAWGWDVAGYAAERRGDLETAKRMYRSASTCSAFTDQSIRLAMHWSFAKSAKFSVGRLSLLCPDEVQSSTYLGLLCEPDAQVRRHQITAYWADQAARFDAAGDLLEAYRCAVAAGWDIGAEPILAYDDLLALIARAADRSDQPARAELARTHARCLKDRYRA